MAVILGKAWEKGRKAQHSHSNRSSERKGDADMWLLSFHSICHIIKSLAWELIKAWFSYSATCCCKAHTDPRVEVHAVYTPVSTITQLSQTTLTFFQTHRKNEAHGEVSKQSGICRKTAACRLQVCSVIGKIEHAAFFKQPNHIYYYIRLTHHKLFSCNGRIFNLISWTQIISQLQNCNNFLSSHCWDKPINLDMF